MTRTLLALLLLCILGSPAMNQTKEPKPPSTGTTRVAVIDIGYVFNGYSKSRTNGRIETAESRVFFEKKGRLDAEAKALQTALAARDFSAASEENLRAAIAKNKKDQEAAQQEKQEGHLVALWKDVRAAIDTYAAENKIDLVLGYGEPQDKAMLDLFPNVKRKMQAMDAGSALPLFVGAGADISQEVTVLLNKRAFEKTRSR